MMNFPWASGGTGGIGGDGGNVSLSKKLCDSIGQGDGQIGVGPSIFLPNSLLQSQCNDIFSDETFSTDFAVVWGAMGVSNPDLFYYIETGNFLAAKNLTGGSDVFFAAIPGSIIGFDINPVDGRAYCLLDGSPMVLREINLSDGSTISNQTLAAPQHDNGRVGLIIDNSGNFIIAGQDSDGFTQINPSDGSTIAILGNPGQSMTKGFAYDRANDRIVFIESATDTTIYEVTYTPGGAGSASSNSVGTLTDPIGIHPAFAYLENIPETIVVNEFTRVIVIDDEGNTTTYDFDAIGNPYTVQGTVSECPIDPVVISKEFNDEVALGNFEGFSSDTKFGSTQVLSTSDSNTDVWYSISNYSGQPENYTPETVNIVSSDVNDTDGGTGARTIRIYGLETETSEFYTSEDLVLSGTSPVTSTKTWWRLNRAKILTGGSSKENVGDISISATTSSHLFAVIPATFNQTNVAAFTVPAKHRMKVKYSGIEAIQSNGSAGAALCTLRARDPGSVYRTIKLMGTKPRAEKIVPYIFDPGTDIKVHIEAIPSNNTLITAEIEFTLIPIT